MLCFFSISCFVFVPMEVSHNWFKWLSFIKLCIDGVGNPSRDGNYFPYASLVHGIDQAAVYCCNSRLLSHWGRVTHIYVSTLTSTASDNGLSPGRRQAIIWNNAGILLIGPLGTNFSEILIEIQIFSLKKIRLKMSSAKCRSFCLGLIELTHPGGRVHNMRLQYVWVHTWWRHGI